MATKVIQPKSLPDPRPRYSQGIQTSGGKLLFIAGQTAVDQDGNVVEKAILKSKPSRYLKTSRPCSKQRAEALRT